MKRPTVFRPSLTILESRWLPTVGPYSDIFRNAMQQAYVAQADQATNPVVFLGDSITYNWGTSTRVAPGSAVFSNAFASLDAANFGISGDTTQNLLDRIEGGDLNGQPKVAVVMIGVNDLLQGKTVEQAALGVTAVVEAIRSESPKTDVLLLGVLPTDIPALNPEIEALDAAISQLGSDPGVTYLNPGTDLGDASGNARSSLLMDAVHPDAAGYQILESAILGTVLDLLGAASPTTSTTTTTTTASTSTGQAAKSSPTPATSTDPAVLAVELIPLVSDSPPSDAADAPMSNHPRSFASELVDVSTS